MSRKVDWKPVPLSPGVKKILVLKFKYIGDVVLATPALRALRTAHPHAELHVLTAEDAAPCLQHLPWIDKVWAMPRTRGKVSLRRTLPMLRALRNEKFDASVDLVGNHRGALLSRMIGARRRLGVVVTDTGLPVRAWLSYNQLVDDPDTTRHQAVRDYYILQAWAIPPPSHWESEVRPNPELLETAKQWLPQNSILIHVSTSQEKKEWPTSSWIDLGHRLKAANHTVVFSSGVTQREQMLLEPLRAAGFTCMAPTLSFELFIAILSRAQIFICGDSAPLHLAAGLGVRTIGLFGTSNATCWAPIGRKQVAIQGAECLCSGHWKRCLLPLPCIQKITPDHVFHRVTQN